jgi:hypothetical protein
MAGENRFLVLEGYDSHPYNQRGRRGAARAWCARKVGRKRVVERVTDAASCSGEVVYAKTKKAARKQAFGNLGRTSAGRTSAQERFTRAAHACARQHSGGRNRAYLSCMKEKLSK